MTTAEYLRILAQMVDAADMQGIEGALSRNEIGRQARVDTRIAAARMQAIVAAIDRYERGDMAAPHDFIQSAAWWRAHLGVELRTDKEWAEKAGSCGHGGNSAIFDNSCLTTPEFHP